VLTFPSLRRPFPRLAFPQRSAIERSCPGPSQSTYSTLHESCCSFGNVLSTLGRSRRLGREAPPGVFPHQVGSGKACLENPNLQEELLCRVTSSDPSFMGKTQVAVELITPTHGFGARPLIGRLRSRIDIDKSVYHQQSHSGMGGNGCSQRHLKPSQFSETLHRDFVRRSVTVYACCHAIQWASP
jgi:hypothetical protein